MPQQRRWHIYDDVAQLRERAAAAIMRIAAESIAANGKFYLVLAGGETPRAIYCMLSQASAQWQHWQVYFGDERVAGIDDPERNSVMANSAWLHATPSVQVHPIQTELGGERAAADYAKVVREIRFDLVLLGLGEDGHTASLFRAEHYQALEDDVIVVHDAPKPPAQRVSLTPRCFNRAERVLFLVSGATKNLAVRRWQAAGDIAAGAISPAAGVDILIERVAFS